MKFSDITILGVKPAYSQDDCCIIIIYPFEIHISKAKPFTSQPVMGFNALPGKSSFSFYDWTVCLNIEPRNKNTILANHEVSNLNQAIQEAEIWICQALSLIGDNIDKARQWRNVIEVHSS